MIVEITIKADFVITQGQQRRRIAGSVRSMGIAFVQRISRVSISSATLARRVIGISATNQGGESEMNKKEFEAVKQGDKILHKHYGECMIQEIMGRGEDFFGIIIQPLTDEGKLLLHYHSGAPLGTPLLEHSLHQFRPIDRPFKEESKGLIHFRKLIQEAVKGQEAEQQHVS